jgi:uncharacterized pyridoxamine 5'-phosphate oxidase family protein
MRSLLVVIALAVLVSIAFLTLGDPGCAGDEPVKADAVTAATGSPGMGGTDTVNMEDVIGFADAHKYGYLATIDNGKPRVRGFAIMKIEGDTLYFGTHNTGATSMQLREVPHAEFITNDPKTYTTLRISGDVVFVEDKEIKRKALEADPMMAKMFKGRENTFEYFYLVNIEPNWWGMWEFPEDMQGGAGEGKSEAKPE